MRTRIMPWILLAVLGFGAHGISLHNPFVFDDVDAIVENPAKLWPPRAAFTAPAGSGASGRPLTALSIAVDRTLFGLRPAGWHAVNIVLLVLLGWAIFALVRGTLRAVQASWLALAAAALWIVHPLHAAVIDHVVYRNELLAGLFITLLLLCLRRAAVQPRWGVAAVAASAAAMASKETAVVAPVLALSYDALFLADSLRDALRQRGRLYLGLAATWIVLAACMASGDRGASVTERFADVTRFDYARTQLGVVAHYLRLVFLPRPLVLDYDWPIARSWGEVALPGLFVLLLLGATGMALARRRGIGFLGAAFFLLLSPSSSFVPLTGAVAAEHRMCVPLSCVAVAVVLAGAALLARAPLGRGARWGVGVAAVAIAVALLAAQAIARHRDFATTIGIWADTAGKVPRNPRAQGNWGAALLEARRPADAISPLERALELQPEFVAARANLASAHRRLGFEQAARGATDSAVVHLRPAVQLAPEDVAAENALAWILATSADATVRNPAAALAHARLVEQRAPGNLRAEILDTLAAALAANAEFEAAERTARTAQEVALQRGDRDLAARIGARAAQYAAHQPYREPQAAPR